MLGNKKGIGTVVALVLLSFTLVLLFFMGKSIVSWAKGQINSPDDLDVSKITKILGKNNAGQQEEVLTPTQAKIDELEKTVVECYRNKCRQKTFVLETKLSTAITKDVLVNALKKDSAALKRGESWESLVDMPANVEYLGNLAREGAGDTFYVQFIPKGSYAAGRDSKTLSDSLRISRDLLELAMAGPIKIEKTDEPVWIGYPVPGKMWEAPKETPKIEKNYIYIYFDKPYTGWDEEPHKRDISTISSALRISRSEKILGILFLPSAKEDWTDVCDECTGNKMIGTDEQVKKPHIIIRGLKSGSWYSRNYYLIHFNEDMDIGPDKERIEKYGSYIWFYT